MTEWYWYKLGSRYNTLKQKCWFLINGFILVAYQPVLGYFMPKVTFIVHSYLHFLCIFFLVTFFVHSPIKYKQFLSTMTFGQSGPESNANEGVLNIPWIFRTLTSPSDAPKVGVLPLRKGYSQHILSPVNRSKKNIKIEQSTQIQN